MDFAKPDRLKQKLEDPIERYCESAEFQFAADGEGPALRRSDRDQLLALGIASNPDVSELDGMVLERVMSGEYVNPVLLSDDSGQPLEKWWWHLGAIRRREYPAKFLPEHLRAVYEEMK